MPNDVALLQLVPDYSSSHVKNLKRKSAIFNSIDCICPSSELNSNYPDLRKSPTTHRLLEDINQYHHDFFEPNNDLVKKQKIHSTNFSDPMCDQLNNNFTYPIIDFMDEPIPIANNDTENLDNDLEFFTTEDLENIACITTKEKLITLYGAKILNEPDHFITILISYYKDLELLGFNKDQIFRILKSNLGEQKANLIIERFNLAFDIKKIKDPSILMEYVTCVACGEIRLTKN
ncbi:MAG: hypothetical protein V4629_11790 [Pseudomonadota bacterium]